MELNLLDFPTTEIEVPNFVRKIDAQISVLQAQLKALESVRSSARALCSHSRREKRNMDYLGDYDLYCVSCGKRL